MLTGLKQVTMKDVAYMSADAWNDLPSITLVRSLNKLLQ